MVYIIFSLAWGFLRNLYGLRWGDNENYQVVLTDFVTAHVAYFWKRVRKIGSATQSQGYQKTLLWEKNNQAKQNKNKKMIKTEIALKKFVFRVCREKNW